MDKANDIQLTFDGEATAGHRVDADVAAAALLGLQKSVQMIASAHRDTWSGEKRKFRASNAVREEVVLQVSAAEPGSFVLPMNIAASDLERSTIVESFNQFVDWICDSRTSPDALNPYVLEHLLRITLEWLPARDDLTTVFRFRGGTRKAIDSHARDRAQNLLTSRVFEELTIRGEVIRAYIAEGSVQVRYPITKRTFRIPVPDEVQSQLKLQTDQWLDVRARFRCNRDSEPIDIEDVLDVALPDLTPLVVKDIPLDNGLLTAREVLQLPVALDADTHQLFVVELPDIGLHAFAFSREHLLAEIAEQIAFLWTTYVTIEVSMLAPDALRLREGLLRRFEELSRDPEEEYSGSRPKEKGL